jgi:hypothetical protein
LKWARDHRRSSETVPKHVEDGALARQHDGRPFRFGSSGDERLERLVASVGLVTRFMTDGTQVA